MYYMQNVSSQSFRGLDYSNVLKADRRYVKRYLNNLKTYGNLYDIKLTSTYADIPNMAAIDIEARPLKEGLNFFKRLFRPCGKNTFMTSRMSDKDSSIIKSVEAAIVDLGKKMSG